MEICKVATTTLSHEQIVDLLRTSAVVNVVVVPTMEDGSFRVYCPSVNKRHNHRRTAPCLSIPGSIESLPVPISFFFFFCFYKLSRDKSKLTTLLNRCILKRYFNSLMRGNPISLHHLSFKSSSMTVCHTK
ncbi:signal-induced proliferation-associated 1-like protein 3 [Bulinus truncatus]|nr:signal-induced proliferation-associated 1-like protein 3 [Bulinus truncatus]